jgi:uncharacterized protein (DUF4415 family)
VAFVRKEYDLTRLAWRRNPYARRSTKSVTIRLDRDIIDYFKRLGQETGVAYQRLINLYLRDCAAAKRRPSLRFLRLAAKSGLP